MRNNTGLFQYLTREIQEQGLRTYLLTYGQYYVSLSLSNLCSLFELSETDVRSIVNKMIINDEFYASWNQLSDFIVVNCVEPTPLQSLVLSYSEKMNSFLETDERSLTSTYATDKEYKIRQTDRAPRGTKGPYTKSSTAANRNQGRPDYQNSWFKGYSNSGGYSKSKKS